MSRKKKEARSLPQCRAKTKEKIHEMCRGTLRLQWFRVYFAFASEEGTGLTRCAVGIGLSERRTTGGGGRGG